MLVQIENPIILLRAIEIISDLVTEVRIKINEFGMSITAIDPANVAMVSFRLPKTNFSKFETGEESLGVNIDSFKKILKRVSSSSSLILEKKENLLSIEIQDRIQRRFTLNLIEIEREDKDLPNLEFSSLIEINSGDLINSIEDCAVVADACSFIVEEGKFIIESKGLNSARSEFSGDEAKIDAEATKSRYSLEYLQKFMKASKLAEKTVLKFANDHPLRIDINTGQIEVIFILAPRVETED